MQLLHVRRTLGAAALMAVPAAALLVGCGGDGANGGSGGARPTRVVYVSDNNPAGSNIDVYRNDGSGQLGLLQTQASGGRGSAGLEDAARNYFPHDKDNEMITNSAHTLLFAANQGTQPGSNQGSISVFNIGSAGTLTPIAGSPFLSGGTAPVSLALVNNDNTLIVANRDELAEGGVQGPVAGGILNNYVSFKVSSNGAISAPVTTLPVAATTGLPFSALNGVTQVLPAPASLTNKPIVFAVEEGDAIRSLQVNADSTFTEVPGSPFHTPVDGMGPFTGMNAGAGNHVPLGMDVHPNQRIIYVNDVKIASVLVYTYTSSGVLSYAGFVPNTNGVAACWVKVDTLHNKIYTANTLTNSVSIFDISNPLAPVQLAVPTPGTTGPGNVVLSTDGDPYQLALDPQMQFLYVTNPRNFDPNVITSAPRPLGAANTEHVLRINTDGTLTEVSSVKIPNSNGLNIEGGLAL